MAQHLGTTPVRLVPFTSQADATWETARAQKYLETIWKPSKCVQQAISSPNFTTFLKMHESSQNAKNST
jgi:glutaredoxin-related protein